MTVQKTKKKQPKKSAAFGGRLLVLFWDLKYNHFLDFQNKTYRYWVYLMEHMFFEVQLCIKISIFKEKHVFDILIILCLMTSLVLVCALHNSHKSQYIGYIYLMTGCLQCLLQCLRASGKFLLLPLGNIHSWNVALQKNSVKLVTLHPICQIPRTPQHSLKIDFWIHNRTSKNICSKRYIQYGYILCWTPRKYPRLLWMHDVVSGGLK